MPLEENATHLLRGGISLRNLKIMLLTLLLLLPAGCSPARVQEGIHLDSITMPPGFKISLYARVPGARSMTLSPGGVLFVGTRQKNPSHSFAKKPFSRSALA